MFGSSFHLFTLFGFSVRANSSWLLLFALLVWSLSTGFFPTQFPGLQEPYYWLLGLTGTLGLFFSLLFHEFSHSMVARARGMKISGITLFLFGGVAELTEEPRDPKTEFEVAVVGPLSSLFLAALFFAFTVVLGALSAAPAWAGLFSYLSAVNLVLALFNLVPGFPLDGGRLLRAYLWQKRGDVVSATRTAARVGQGFGFTLIAAGGLLILTGGAIGGFWWILIGFFIVGAAKSVDAQTQMRATFEGIPVRRFMTQDPVSVSPDLDLQRLVEDYAYRHHFSMFPVVDGERLVGRVRVRDVRTMPHDVWRQSRVSEIMVPCDETNTVAPDTDTQQALNRMQTLEGGQLLVADGPRLVGILTLRDLVAHLAIRQEIEGRN
ncbi:MAG: site-2 protease family protein [Pseudomonadales bacterium]|jgi:Zn-dependent protease|nr:site-2 protease family protein [Pseudomonadales bacterium]